MHFTRSAFSIRDLPNSVGELRTSFQACQGKRRAAGGWLSIL